MCLSFVNRPDGLGWGYNLNIGGGKATGYKHTEEAKNKIGLAHKGRKHSEEWKKNNSIAHKYLQVGEKTGCMVRNIPKK